MSTWNGNDITPAAGGHRRSTARWLFAGTGPLRRGCDRLEMTFRLLLVLAVLAVAPIGVLQATATYDAEGGISPAQARDHQPVRATVTADPPSADLVPPDADVLLPVTFTAPDGTAVSTTMQLWASTRAQDHITLWVSPHGRLTGPPRERPRSLATAVLAGALAGLTAPVAAWALLGLVHVALEARRSRQWQSEWLAVEPVWTSRRH